MNIKQIISEAIDRTLLEKYSQQMGRYLGTYGLDGTPLGNERTSIAFLQKFNNFCFQVKFAIDSKYYRPSTGRRTATTSTTTSNMNTPSYNTNGGFNMTDFVNTQFNYADDLYHDLGGDDVLPYARGVGRSFIRGYNNGVNAFNRKDFGPQQQQQVQQQKRRTTRSRPQKSGTPLYTLMGTPYIEIMNNFNYAKQMNPRGINNVKGIKELLTILQNIKTALTTTKK